MQRTLRLVIVFVAVSVAAVAQKMPSQDKADPNGFFQCGGGQRYAAASPSEKYLEKGDSWGGIVGRAAICGGCDFADTPAHPKPNPPQFRTYAFIEWGDGQRSDLKLWLPDGEMAADPHPFTSVIDPKKPVKLTIHAWCVNLQRNWEETVTSTCDTAVTECVPSPAYVTVYKNVAPSLVKVVQVVKHGKVALGALSVVLQEAAPLSDTKVTLESSNPLITFRQPPARLGNKVQTVSKKTVTILAGKSAANFDIDATAATRPIRNVTITVSNPGGRPVITKFNVQ